MRDRDEAGRPRSSRPRDDFGRPLPYGTAGVPRVPDDYAPDAREAIDEARRYLETGHPFHAHEVLEARWKTGPSDERELWQGLAQICVGLTHVQRGNPSGAVALLTRGAARLGSYGSRRPFDLDLRAMTLAADQIIVEIDSGTPDANSAISRIVGHLK
ncbi:DUF309 domain-containing protein [Planotetraspora kaengkrachanensis]|uniref:DUF309 domain-containing protein n=1 Tax=Planotetraspora kaengkrachanensis TaxID=575193 RepID=A0A8J3PQ12_9ACTN|nr:DUF309 domain-containing protein [Planotetraspora kaengkrachanensis]GIG78241.1 hypothetical protein Pka01_13680 [Planotetraspora kaengkrachanensis]